MTNGKPGTMTLGWRLETWARGVEMPEPVRLVVRVGDRGRYRILMPCEPEASSSAGKPVPRLIKGDLQAARKELRCLGSWVSLQWAVFQRAPTCSEVLCRAGFMADIWRVYVCSRVFRISKCGVVVVENATVSCLAQSVSLLHNPAKIIREAFPCPGTLRSDAG